jgi:hypothetical protein
MNRISSMSTFYYKVRLVPFSSGPIINDLIERVDKARQK